MAGGVAVINVGAATEVELKDKKERVNDAVAATKAALEEGVVPGGSVALLDISRRMDVKTLGNVARDEMFGYEIVKNALESPFIQLMRNAGLDAGQLIAKARSASALGKGFNILKIDSVDTAQPVDMIKEGISDPLKVVRILNPFPNALALRAFAINCPASRPAFLMSWINGDSKAFLTISYPNISSLATFPRVFTSILRLISNSATDPPGTTPSSRAALVAATASLTRSFLSLSSTSVAAPTLITATPPAIFASLSCSLSRSKSEDGFSIAALM